MSFLIKYKTASGTEVLLYRIFHLIIILVD